MSKILEINSRTKCMLVAILLLAFCFSTVALPSATAHTPAWSIPSYAKMAVAPNPVGVGQAAHISMWVDAPLPDADLLNNIRRSGYTLTITDPDNVNTTQNGI